jgi:hypothetical protein
LNPELEVMDPELEVRDKDPALDSKLFKNHQKHGRFEHFDRYFKVN